MIIVFQEKDSQKQEFQKTKEDTTSSFVIQPWNLSTVTSTIFYGYRGPAQILCGGDIHKGMNT